MVNKKKPPNVVSLPMNRHNWRCTLQHIHAGDHVHVVAALNVDCNHVVIVTTF
jgi:hypothetical protein